MIWRFLVLLLVAPAWAQLSPGPTSVGGGPAYNVNTAAGTTTIVPAAMNTDSNCPATIPSQTGGTAGGVGVLTAGITCPTPAATTTVLSISFFATTGTSGAHQKCSVYTYPAGYVAGTTSVPKVASGCDTVEWTAPGATTNAWVTLATTGTCTLAASTRYQIGCNQDVAYGTGFNNTCTLGGVLCNQQKTGLTYATGALPDPWIANNQNSYTPQFYMTVH